jgi:hypothetical protein
MSGIEWADPPDSRSKNSPRWRDTAEALRQHPKRWAKLGTWPKGASVAYALVTTIRQARTTVWQPRGAYEAAARLEDGQVNVYARYVGDE